MPSVAQIKLAKIQEMLDQCSPGSRLVHKKHLIWVLDARGGIYRGLPKGAHGKGEPKIEFGHIRSMARQLR